MKYSRYAFLLLLFYVLFVLEQPVQAQDNTAYEIINLVNLLRTSYGLAPYQIDTSLMAFAQEHSEYQASINTGTHTHSDGTIPWQIGIQENVANGTMMTPQIAVNQIWSDAVHMKTMVGYSGGFAGAGVAYGADGTVYYTLNVRPAEGSEVTGSQSQVIPTTAGSGKSTGVVTIPQDATAAKVEQVITSTPGTDGMVIHTVGSGQTLWSIAIAYGVTINEIREKNRLPTETNVIQNNQKLLIRIVTPDASGPSLGFQTTAFDPQGNRTPAYSEPVKTMTPSRMVELPENLTKTPVPVQRAAESGVQNNRGFAIGLIVFGVTGLLGMIFSMIRNRKQES